MVSDEVENFIVDWHWDEPSHGIAQEMGAFLLEFIDHLRAKGLSARTIRKHFRNCWAIGNLSCSYGYFDSFDPKLFSGGGPLHLYEFRRKFADTQGQVRSYEVTCRKLARYVQSLDFCDEDE